MKRLLLAVAASLGIGVSGSAARAVPIDFTYTGSLVDFTVPATGSYQIVAFGSGAEAASAQAAAVPRSSVTSS
jgi:hypothetical protein